MSKLKKKSRHFDSRELNCKIILSNNGYSETFFTLHFAEIEQEKLLF